jgi:hypothetical protein
MSSLQDETPNKRSLLIKMDPRKKEKKREEQSSRMKRMICHQGHAKLRKKKKKRNKEGEMKEGEVFNKESQI